MTTSRPRGVMLDRIYTANLNVICKQIYKLQYGVDSTDNVEECWDDLAISRDPNAKQTWYDRDTVLICSEGVGWYCNDQGLILVPMGNDGGIYVSGTVLQRLKTGKQVDLADHVRTFGARLENNFDLWHSRLTASRKEAV
jgi:hypothetical protein